MSYLSTIISTIQEANKEVLEEAKISLLTEDLRAASIGEGREGKNTTILITAHGPKLHGSQFYYYDRKSLSSITIVDPLKVNANPTIVEVLAELTSKATSGKVPSVEDVFSVTLNEEQTSVKVVANNVSLEFNGEATFSVELVDPSETINIADLIDGAILNGFEQDPIEEETPA